MTSPITTPRISITEVKFSGGAVVQFGANDIVIIVGPNNSGKSATLRGIRDKLGNAASASPVVSGLKTARFGAIDIFDSWLDNWAVQQQGGTADNPVYQALGHALHQSQARAEWQRGDSCLGQMVRWFCHLLSADERLQICNPPSNISLSTENPSHPIHFLQRDDKLELRLSMMYRKAFGVDLVVHRNAGGQVPLHVGERPIVLPGEDRVSLSYIRRLEKLPHLHAQGDGMRSFAGVMLATSVGRESIMLIDEPEAFLHPPQARLLGNMLVNDRNKERQLFIATHSTDILRGVLESNSPDIRVIRIRRDKDNNSVKQLENTRIHELWGDPLLRYSDILDGLFHESVVICESDSDCRFYSAVLDSVISSRKDEVRRPDIMFTHCGGKARFPVVIRALKEVDVPVRVVADFDVLADEQPLRSIIESLGADWSMIESDWRLVKSAVESKKPELSSTEIKNGISTVLAQIATPLFPTKAKSEIQSLLKRSSSWSHAKTTGVAFVPSGDPSMACGRLFTNMKKFGLHVVEVGELEGYIRSEGGHGPKWVTSVLERNIDTDSEFDVAKKFVSSLIDLEMDR